jgi:hypothetical protein
MRLLSQDFKFERALVGCATHNEVFPKGFFVGIEVELENHAKTHDAALSSGYWSVHNDGSLRNNGVEYVTIPLDGDNINKGVDLFWDKLDQKVSFSQRTSIHVHVNARQLSYQQMAGLLTAYCVVEPFLFDFVGRGRERNTFCIPITETGYPDKWLADLAKNSSAVIMNWEKYSAVNLSRFQDLGTMEFRHMHGTKDKAKVFLWLEILSCLYQYGVSNPFDRVVEKITTMHPIDFVNEIFTNRVRALFLNKDMIKLISKGHDRVFAAIVGQESTNKILENISMSSPFNEYIKRST